MYGVLMHMRVTMLPHNNFIMRVIVMSVHMRMHVFMLFLQVNVPVAVFFGEHKYAPDKHES